MKQQLAATPGNKLLQGRSSLTESQLRLDKDRIVNVFMVGISPFFHKPEPLP
jgi:hypothetical protein